MSPLAAYFVCAAQLACPDPQPMSRTIVVDKIQYTITEYKDRTITKETQPRGMHWSFVDEKNNQTLDTAVVDIPVRWIPVPKIISLPRRPTEGDKRAYNKIVDACYNEIS